MMIFAFVIIAITANIIQAVPYETVSNSGIKGVREMTGSLFERSAYPDSYEDLLKQGVGFDAAISIWLSQLDIEKAYEESKEADSTVLKPEEVPDNFGGDTSSPQFSESDDADFRIFRNKKRNNL